MTKNVAPGGAADKPQKATDRIPEPPLWEQQSTEFEGERLQKVLARVGFGSRRVCEDLIAEERVTVNGRVAILGRRVDAAQDEICVDGVRISTAPGLVYYLLNKPVGYVTTAADTHGRATVMELVPESPRVFPVGRLDMDTSGLLLLTNDGDLAHRITHPSHGIEKEYVATVECSEAGVGQQALQRLRRGVELEDGITHPAQVTQPQPGLLKITIHEGRNRQIRRMCDAVGHPVVELTRTRIGTLRDTHLTPGEWRDLSSDELIGLFNAVGQDDSDTISQ
jgi:23S rRNA pseudouridine2605 synthase